MAKSYGAWKGYGIQSVARMFRIMARLSKPASAPMIHAELERDGYSLSLRQTYRLLMEMESGGLIETVDKPDDVASSAEYWYRLAPWIKIVERRDGK